MPPVPVCGVHATNRRLGATLATLSCLLPGPALAETSSPDELERILVVGAAPDQASETSGDYTSPANRSATGLSLTPRETPQSVSVITHRRIRDQNLETSGEILESAPGVSMTRSDSNRRGYSSRGFSISSFQFDGLLTPINNFWNFGDTDWDSILYDRVEVVRGATGLMTGAGEPSASVNFIRKRPLDEPQIRAGIAAGSRDRRRVSADISTPLSDDGRVGMRLIAAKDTRDSHVAHLSDDSETFYGVVQAEPSEATTLRAGLEYQHNQTDGAGSGFPIFHADGSRTDYDRSAANNTRWSHFFNETTRGFVDLSHTLDSGWTLRAAYSHDDGNYGLRYLYRGGYPERDTGQGMSPYFANYRGDRTRRDLHLTAEGEVSLFDRRHELGLGWMRVEDQMTIGLASPRGGYPDIGGFFGDDYHRVPEPDWGRHDTIDDGRIVQRGGYAVARLSLADPLSLIAGVRLSDWEIDQTYYGDRRRYAYEDELTPYAGLIYDLDERVSVYASYTSIFDAQNKRAPDGSLLDPVRGDSYEAGLKASLLDGRLDAALAVYRTDQQDLGEAIPGEEVSGRPGTQAYRAVDGARVEGLEAEVVGELADGWRLSASYTLTDAEDADGEATNTDHPRQQVKLFTSYRLPGAWQGLTLGGGARWQSETHRQASSPNGSTRVGQDAYLVADLMARYRFSDRLSAQLDVNNVFDERYYEQIGFYSQAWWGEPRSAVLSLDWQW